MKTEVFSIVRGEVKTPIFYLSIGLFLAFYLIAMVLDSATVSSQRIMYKGFLLSSHSIALNLIGVFYTIHLVSKFRDSQILDLFVNKGWKGSHIFGFFMLSALSVMTLYLLASHSLIFGVLFNEIAIDLNLVLIYAVYRFFQVVTLLLLTLHLIKYLSVWVASLAALSAYFMFENLSTLARFVFDSPDQIYKFIGSVILTVFPDFGSGSPVDEIIYYLDMRQFEFWFGILQMALWSCILLSIGVVDRSRWS